MLVFKKALFAFCVFSLAVFALLDFWPMWQVGLLRLALASTAIYWLRKFLRKELDWVSSAVASLGVVFLTTVLATGIDFLIASKATN